MYIKLSAPHAAKILFLKFKFLKYNTSLRTADICNWHICSRRKQQLKNTHTDAKFKDNCNSVKLVP